MDILDQILGGNRARRLLAEAPSTALPSVDLTQQKPGTQITDAATMATIIAAAEHDAPCILLKTSHIPPYNAVWVVATHAQPTDNMHIFIGYDPPTGYAATVYTDLAICTFVIGSNATEEVATSG